MKHITIGVDLAKNIFEIAASRRAGTVAEGHRLSRRRFGGFFANRPPATVMMEAYGSAHFGAREIRRAGHQVLLLPAYRVRPYVGRNETDASDARAFLEAARNQEIRPVPAKTVSQQALEDGDSGVPDGVRPTLAALGAEVQSLEAELRLAERQLEALAAETPVVTRLRTIPGVGHLTVTVLGRFSGVPSAWRTPTRWGDGP